MGRVDVQKMSNLSALILKFVAIQRNGIANYSVQSKILKRILRQGNLNRFLW